MRGAALRCSALAILAACDLNLATRDLRCPAIRTLRRAISCVLRFELCGAWSPASCDSNPVARDSGVPVCDLARRLWGAQVLQQHRDPRGAGAACWRAVHRGRARDVPRGRLLPRGLEQGARERPEGQAGAERERAPDGGPD
eukprot:9239536-Alexandrium_andersonii.AAC.1